MTEKTTTRASRYLFEAFEAKCGDALAKLVLLHLANRADNNGECFPSLARIARDCETSESSVKRKLLLLEKLGLVKRINRAVEGMKTSNLYQLPHNYQGFSVGSERPIDRSERAIDGSEGHDRRVTVTPTDGSERPIKHAFETPNETRRTDDDLFESFWQGYGYKKDKAKARKAWSKIGMAAQVHVIALMRDQKFIAWRDDQLSRGYLPYPSSWLNGERWEDDLEDPKCKKAYVDMRGALDD